MNEREFALQMSLAQYTGKPCRICGQLLTMADIVPGGAVFMGVDAGGSRQAAHGLCWRNMIDVLRQLETTGQLRRILEDGK